MSDLKILNGRFSNDKGVGALTCRNKNGGDSAVDYYIASNNLFPDISSFSVDTFDRCMSDVHHPISLELNPQQCLEIENAVVCDKDNEQGMDFFTLPFYVIKIRLLN